MHVFPAGSLGPLDILLARNSLLVALFAEWGWGGRGPSAASLHLWEPGTTFRAVLRTQGPVSLHSQTSGLPGSPLKLVKGNLWLTKTGSKVKREVRKGDQGSQVRILALEQAGATAATVHSRSWSPASAAPGSLPRPLPTFPGLSSLPLPLSRGNLSLSDSALPL